MKMHDNNGFGTVAAVVLLFVTAIIVGTGVDVIDNLVNYPDATGKHVYQLRVGEGNSMVPVMRTGDTLYMVWDWNGIQEGYVIAGNGVIHPIRQIKRDADGKPVWARCMGINNCDWDKEAITERTYRDTLVKVVK